MDPKTLLLVLSVLSSYQIGRAEREDKNRGRISASRNSEIFEYSFGVF